MFQHWWRLPVGTGALLPYARGRPAAAEPSRLEQGCQHPFHRVARLRECRLLPATESLLSAALPVGFCGWVTVLACLLRGGDLLEISCRFRCRCQSFANIWLGQNSMSSADAGRLLVLQHIIRHCSRCAQSLALHADDLQVLLKLPCSTTPAHFFATMKHSPGN